MQSLTTQVRCYAQHYVSFLKMAGDMPLPCSSPQMRDPAHNLHQMGIHLHPLKYADIKGVFIIIISQNPDKPDDKPRMQTYNVDLNRLVLLTT